MVECSVEVGIVDMYGAATDQPMKFLGSCLSILLKEGVNLPSIEPIARLGRPGVPWEEAYPKEDISPILMEYGITSPAK